MRTVLRVEVFLVSREQDLAVAIRAMERPRLAHDPLREDGHVSLAEFRRHPAETKTCLTKKVPARLLRTGCPLMLPPMRRRLLDPARKKPNGGGASVRSSMRELPLRPYHEFGGAMFRAEAGWNVPAEYSSMEAEVRAVRTAAGVIDLSDRSKLELRGSERVPFLDGLVTADIKILAPGTSAYALLLNEKSRVLGELRVYAFPDSLVLDIEAGQADRVLKILEKARVSDDVEFRDVGLTGHLGIDGPAAAGVVTNAARVDVRGLGVEAFVNVAIDKRREGHIVRVRPTGENGFQVWAPEASLAEMWQAALRSGAAPVGRDAYEVLRIEAGIPRFGAEMNEGTLALEVAPPSALSFTKGCYIGQEVVARGTYVGQIRRKLMGLRVEADIPPVRGDRVSKGDREVGFITSGAWSPTLGWNIALALLRIDEVGPSDSLFIDRGGWDLRARLHPLPFVQPRS